jgi:hypothetical protein
MRKSIAILKNKNILKQKLEYNLSDFIYIITLACIYADFDSIAYDI